MPVSPRSNAGPVEPRYRGTGNQWTGFRRAIMRRVEVRTVGPDAVMMTGVLLVLVVVGEGPDSSS
jgi:hypothetical protein